MSINKERIDWIDNLRGAGIFVVILGHLTMPSSIDKFIYSFHMPLFFFLSGFLFDLAKYDLRTFIKRKFLTLIVPYCCFALLSVPIGLCFGKFSGLNTIYELLFLKGSVGWNSPIWFLVCLFIVEVLYFIIRKYISYKYFFIPVIAFIFLGFIITRYHIVLPFGIHIAIFGIVFFSLGEFMKQNNRMHKMNGILWILGFLFLTAFVGIKLNIRVSIYHLEIGNYLYFYLAAIAGCLFSALLFANFRKSPLLTYLGQNSIIILSLHYIFINIFNIIGLKQKLLILIENYASVCVIEAIVITVACLPIILTINRYAPFIIGKQHPSFLPKIQ